ncbi:hypothetical protein BVL40_10890 [Corynebacterium diphtheriae]|nr:hypothetical protein BVL40_10890 [Corynebacterium diphtheriae]
MGLRSHEYEDTTKSNTRQGSFLVLVCTRVSGILQHESVITKPHHHAHTQAPTMGLRSHEYENTKHTPLALKTSSPPHPTPRHKKRGRTPLYKNTPHTNTLCAHTPRAGVPTHTTPHTTHAHIKKGVVEG